MFIAALFIIAPKWRQPKRSTDKWINKMWYYPLKVIILAIKSNEVLMPAAT